MKKYYLTLIVLLGVLVNMNCFGQVDTTLTLKMKGAKMVRMENGVPVFEISMSRLRKLKLIECSDKKFTVESFVFTYPGRTFTLGERHIKGNSFELCFKDLTSTGVISLFYLESIVVTNAQGEKRNLRPIKVLVV